jgi:hypothetical protein
MNETTKAGKPRLRAPGAGRKPKPATEQLTRRTVRMDDDRWRWCEEQGNASEYIRALIDRDRKARANAR